jgi:hypothetical protein
MVMQHESAKRIALEQRLHSQLLLQNETMVAMELKLLRLESKVERREAAQRQQQQRVGNVRSNAPAIQTIEEVSRQLELRVPPQHGMEPANMAVFSSGASLASGVTVGSFVGDGDESERQSRADEDAESQQSSKYFTYSHSSKDILKCRLVTNLYLCFAPFSHLFFLPAITLGSRAHNLIAGDNLESILFNPMLGETNSATAHSIHATRGDTDENSSLGTAVTNSTMTCTVGTATTRGDYSIRDRFLSLDPENRRATSALTEDSYNTSSDAPRSRSNSPLTIQSYTVNSETRSVGSGASQSTAIMSSVAVAPARTADILQNQPNIVNEHCDSITMPDAELDNLSEVAVTLASSARGWRDEYEARLDAIQKRMTSE